MDMDGKLVSNHIEHTKHVMCSYISNTLFIASPLRFHCLSWWSRVVAMHSLMAMIMSKCLHNSPNALKICPTSTKTGPFTWDGLFIMHAFIGFRKLLPEYKHINKRSMHFILGKKQSRYKKWIYITLRQTQMVYVSIHSLPAGRYIFWSPTKLRPLDVFQLALFTHMGNTIAKWLHSFPCNITQRP